MINDDTDPFYCSKLKLLTKVEEYTDIFVHFVLLRQLPLLPFSPFYLFLSILSIETIVRPNLQGKW